MSEFKVGDKVKYIGRNKLYKLYFKQIKKESCSHLRIIKLSKDMVHLVGVDDDRNLYIKENNLEKLSNNIQKL